MARRAVLPRIGRDPIGRLTDSGLWAYSLRAHGVTVTVRENRDPGAPLVWDYSGHRARSLGETIRVRNAGGDWDLDAVKRAVELVERRHDARRMHLGEEDIYASAVRGEADRFRVIAEQWIAPHQVQAFRSELARMAQRIVDLPRGGSPRELTVEEGFALFFDAETGGLPSSRSGLSSYRRAKEVWTAALRDPRSGASLRWNDVTLAHVEAVAYRMRDEEHVVQGATMVLRLNTVHRWLRRKRRMRELENPTEGFDFKSYYGGYEPRQPRYTKSELKALLKVRDQVDPRFALLVVLIRLAGDRREAYRQAKRSDLNCQLDNPPSPEIAPHGWLRLPGLKGQRAQVVYLRARQRAEVDKALAGYLRDLEAAYQAGEIKDYPLFPGARLKGGGGRPVRVKQPGAFRPVSPMVTDLWLLDAHDLARVPKIERRRWHGFRRSVGDEMYEALGLDAAAAAMGYSGPEMLRNVYLDKGRQLDRGKARTAMEGVGADDE